MHSGSRAAGRRAVPLHLGLLAFGHRSLPMSFASARRGKVTCGKARISFHPPPYPKHIAPFLNGNLLDNFPAPYVCGVTGSLWVPANRGSVLERIERSSKSGHPSQTHHSPARLPLRDSRALLRQRHPADVGSRSCLAQLVGAHVLEPNLDTLKRSHVAPQSVVLLLCWRLYLAMHTLRLLTLQVRYVL